MFAFFALRITKSEVSLMVSRIAEIKLVPTLKQKNIDNYHNKVFCIYICNHIFFKKTTIFQQKNIQKKILVLFLTKKPAKWDILIKFPLIRGSLKWDPR